MKFLNNIKWLMLVVLVQINISHAQEMGSIDCTVSPYNGVLFNNYYKEVKKTAAVLCNELIRSRIVLNGIDNQYIGSILSDFASYSEKELNNKGLNQSANYAASFSQLRTAFKKFDFNNMRMPEFRVNTKIDSGEIEGYFSSVNSAKRFPIKQVDYCNTISQGKRCKDIFKDYSDAFNTYRSAYKNIHNNDARLSELGRRWDDFLSVSKSQTSLEVLLTTWLHSEQFKKNHLVGPPSYQVIAFHPHLIYSNMDKAADGSNQEMGLAIEWLGVNFWDLDVPIGISVSSTYVDRPGVKDEGLGIMLHINNRYSIGWSKHGDTDSFYVTIDLLKMFEDKKTQYDTYVNQYY